MTENNEEWRAFLRKELGASWENATREDLRDLMERYSAIIRAQTFIASAQVEVIEAMSGDMTLADLRAHHWNRLSEHARAFVVWVLTMDTLALPVSVLTVNGVDGEWHRAFEMIGEDEEDFVETPEMRLARETFGGEHVEFNWAAPPATRD